MGSPVPLKLFEGGSSAESPMDRLVKTACEAFDAPIGLVSVYGEDGAMHRTIQGLDGIAIPPDFHVANTLIAMGPGATMIVADASRDPRVEHHPFVTGPLGLRFYAGATICDHSGVAIGAIGVMDRSVRGDLTAAQKAALRRFAAMAGDLVELERAQRESEAKRRTLELAEEMVGVGHFRLDAITGEITWSDQVFRIHGFEPGEVDATVESALGAYHPDDAEQVRDRIAAAICTGLGLAISRRLIEMMEGQIGADSQVGSGSTFWFEAPLKSVLTRSPRAALTRAVSPGRILVVDDSAATRRMLTTILTECGLEIETVSNGAEAVTAARTGHYDAILMDVHMPVLDGVEAARTIHAMQGSEARTRIIALTAAVQDDQVRRYALAGMSGHVGKPVRPDELIRHLDSVLSGLAA